MTRAWAIGSICAGGIVCALAGCALFTDLEGFDCGADGCQDAGSDTSSTTDATTNADVQPGTDAGAGDASAEAGRCPDGRGPKMIVGGSFCIDSTEVTNNQYSKFVDDLGFDAGPPPAVCADVTNHLPGCDYDPAGQANRPVRCVSWCNAWAFCRWSGKRLCGKIGGGPITGTESSDDPTISEWMAACTRNGQRAFSYGTVQDPTKCPGDDVPHDVGTIATCEGGYSGLFDMNGNVEEWEDACRKVDGGVVCEKRGGDYESSIGACSWSFGEDVFEANDDTGIRCCAD